MSKDTNKLDTNQRLMQTYFLENQLNAVLREFDKEPFKVKFYYVPPELGTQVQYIERDGDLVWAETIRISMTDEELLSLDAVIRQRVVNELRERLRADKEAE